jgi:hypothetical protein
MRWTILALCLCFVKGYASDNHPWYKSLEAFEHYNSGRSHVFPEAKFRGSYIGNNTVGTLYSTTAYPSGYNM